MIVGEPGIGKSRLVEEFRAQLGRRHTHGSNRGGGTRAVDQHQARSDASSWPCAIPGRVLVRRTSNRSSTPSAPPSPVEQGGAVDMPVHHRCSRGKLWAEANEPCGDAFRFTLPGIKRSTWILLGLFDGPESLANASRFPLPARFCCKTPKTPCGKISAK